MTVIVVINLHFILIQKKAIVLLISATKPDVAIPLYKNFIKSIELVGKKCKLVFFGADMKISLLNDG
jgi:D-Tyr-tRNAtyr deacylase